MVTRTLPGVDVAISVPLKSFFLMVLQVSVAKKSAMADLSRRFTV